MISMFNKSSKRERREAKKRENERLAERAELVRIRNAFGNREAKVKQLQKMEKLQSFQKDLLKMKELYKKPKQMKPVPRDPQFFKMKKDIPKDPQFFKSKTDLEIKGMDKQFKKKGFMLL